MDAVNRLYRDTHVRRSPVRPFLKWAGNKFRILDRIQRQLPKGDRLVEPFVGSGAVFLNTDFPAYRLSDSNADLINVYRTLQRDGRDFIEACAPMFTPDNNRQERYYSLRDEFNACRDPLRRAVLFVYLNRHGYNGLCRYNAKGGFNVPFGRYKKPYFPGDEMLDFHARSRDAEFLCRGFEEALQDTRPGDVVYCDPPYVPLSPSSNFTSYSAGGFTPRDQQALAESARMTAGRGIPVLVSNHDTREAREAYKGASFRKFQVQRFISCNGAKRGKAGELLALFV